MESSESQIDWKFEKKNCWFFVRCGNLKTHSVPVPQIHMFYRYEIGWNSASYGLTLTHSWQHFQFWTTMWENNAELRFRKNNNDAEKENWQEQLLSFMQVVDRSDLNWSNGTQTPTLAHFKETFVFRRQIVSNDHVHFFSVGYGIAIFGVTSAFSDVEISCGDITQKFQYFHSESDHGIPVGSLRLPGHCSIGSFLVLRSKAGAWADFRCQDSCHRRGKFCRPCCPAGASKVEKDT